MIHIRNFEQSENDLEFLTDMMYEAIHIPENKPSKDELLNLPHIKKYSEGWGRQGDRALIAFNKDHFPVGAAWYRLFKENQKGYGYVDDKTPELGIALSNEARGKRIGTLLMERLFETASRDGYRSLSLSVDPNNTQAVQLYKKLGFEQCGSSGTSWTMIYHISSD
ncbi:GNAT family N-acetyltransferase [Bacillus sp. CLL-7-23]|uniref:GNAT family N-acetyltransferase n=1 Tax=Bacillus changyiensis TaxID=3004103 RepID=A0ABT4X1W3_9BACI|nr:GNAT family N-acetyltransferase [Bacillus changyiensis]MDA7026285.1 GNAT family N-acetyltransferase [Bacillus changyiensis]